MVQRLPDCAVLSNAVRYIFDVTDDSAPREVRRMNPKYLFGDWIALPKPGCRDVVAKVLLPARLGHPLLWVALEIPTDLVAIRAAEIEQLSQAVKVRHIGVLESYDWEEHEEH
jgi:hypothetical protein